MGSHQRGAETLPGAGMGCPRAGPPSSGKESGNAGKGGGVVPGWREQGGVLAPHLLQCSVGCGGPFQMPLCLFASLP